MRLHATYLLPVAGQQILYLSAARQYFLAQVAVMAFLQQAHCNLLQIITSHRSQ
jgi:hypothetical protein